MKCCYTELNLNILKKKKIKYTVIKTQKLSWLRCYDFDHLMLVHMAIVSEHASQICSSKMLYEWVMWWEIYRRKLNSACVLSCSLHWKQGARNVARGQKVTLSLRPRQLGSVVLFCSRCKSSYWLLLYWYFSRCFLLLFYLLTFVLTLR